MRKSLMETVDQLKVLVLSVIESENFPLRCLFEPEELENLSKSVKFEIWENPFNPLQLAVQTDLLSFLGTMSDVTTEDLRMMFGALLGMNELFIEERWVLIDEFEDVELPLRFRS